MTLPLTRPEPRASPAGRYTWRLWNVVGWYEEGFLPLRTVSYGWKRNDIGQIQASLPLQMGTPPVRPGEHAVIVEKDEHPMWMGPIYSDPFDTESAYVNLNGSEWQSYLRRRRIRVDRNFSQVDQFDIARQLLSDTQTAHWGHGDLRIRWLPTLAPDWGWAQRSLSGVLRDRNYAALDRKEVFETLQNLADVINGFDFRFRPVYVGGEPVIWFELFYPREDPERSFPPLEYKQGWPGSNVDSYRWTDNASDMANVTEAANDEAVAGNWDPSAWNWYPVLEAMVQRGGEGGVTNVDTLQQHADALLEERRRPRASCTVTTVPNLPGLGPDMIGAAVRFRATSWRHPPGPNGEPGLDRTMRIEEVTVNAPNDERAENATITMLEIPGGRP